MCMYMIAVEIVNYIDIALKTPSDLLWLLLKVYAKIARCGPYSVGLAKLLTQIIKKHSHLHNEIRTAGCGLDRLSQQALPPRDRNH